MINTGEFSTMDMRIDYEHALVAFSQCYIENGCHIMRCCGHVFEVHYKHSSVISSLHLFQILML